MHTHTHTHVARFHCVQGQCSLSKTIRKVLCRIVSPDNTDLPFDFSNRDEERRNSVSSVLNPWNGWGHRLIHPPSISKKSIFIRLYIYITYTVILSLFENRDTLVTPCHHHYFVPSIICRREKKEEKFPIEIHFQSISLPSMDPFFQKFIRNGEPTVFNKLEHWVEERSRKRFNFRRMLPDESQDRGRNMLIRTGGEGDWKGVEKLARFGFGQIFVALGGSIEINIAYSLMIILQFPFPCSRFIRPPRIRVFRVKRKLI